MTIRFRTPSLVWQRIEVDIRLLACGRLASKDFTRFSRIVEEPTVSHEELFAVGTAVEIESVPPSAGRVERAHG